MNYIKYSPRRKVSFAQFITHFNEESPGPNALNLRPLCPTRWTMRGPAISAFLQQYGGIIDWLVEQTEDRTVSAGMSSKARSLINQMHKFKIYFGLRLLDSLYMVTNPPHTRMQAEDVSVQYVRRLLEGICEALSIKMSDQPAVDFYTETVVATIELGIDQPRAPRGNSIRRRRGPMVEYEVEEELIANTYTKLYKDFYNKAITSLIERYPSDELEELEKLENVLCKPCSEDVAHVFERYKDDLPRGCTIETLTHEIKQIHQFAKARRMVMGRLSVENLATLFDVDYLEVLCPAALTLLTLYLVVPATTCSAERSFTQLRRIKDYLRTTTGQDRLNHCGALCIHKKMVQCGTINIVKAADLFIRNTQRENIFGKPIKPPMYWMTTDLFEHYFLGNC